jgi:hypothetical protein
VVIQNWVIGQIQHRVWGEFGQRLCEEASGIGTSANLDPANRLESAGGELL